MELTTTEKQLEVLKASVGDDETKLSGVRTISNYPDSEMEDVYLKIMGIWHEPQQIAKHKAIAAEHKVDWLVHLREVSEEIQLYRHLGIVDKAKEYPSASKYDELHQGIIAAMDKCKEQLDRMYERALKDAEERTQ